MSGPDTLMNLQVRRLLETESCISLEARAAAEEAQRRLALAQQEAASELARLRRELDRRDERIRRLEVSWPGGRAGQLHVLHTYACTVYR
jgi:hypothetical protein